MLSIVIPVFNEAESLRELHFQLSEVAQREDYDLQIVLVDDGSTDGSWDAIQSLAASDARVHGIRLRRNFGKASALSAGFAAARGELVMTLDADLQDDPAEIPHFVSKLGKDTLDVVSGWKRVRHDPWHKVLPSRVFNWLVSTWTGVRLHDHNCGMKCYRQQVIREVNLYGELHRFVPVLAAARGFRIGEVVVQHRPRKHGRSKYGWSRIGKGLLDLLTVKFLTGFNDRPQHLLGGIGLLSVGLAGLSLIYLAICWIVSRLVPEIEPINLHARAALYYSLALLILGGQFMSIGFVSELITAHLADDRQSFSIAETTSSSTDKSAET